MPPTGKSVTTGSVITEYLIVLLALIGILLGAWQAMQLFETHAANASWTVSLPL